MIVRGGKRHAGQPQLDGVADHDFGRPARSAIPGELGVTRGGIGLVKEEDNGIAVQDQDGAHARRPIGHDERMQRGGHRGKGEGALRFELIDGSEELDAICGLPGGDHGERPAADNAAATRNDLYACGHVAHGDTSTVSAQARCRRSCVRACCSWVARSLLCRSGSERDLCQRDSLHRRGP